MKVETGAGTACRRCGQADTGFEVVSAHRTTQGVVRYVRCTICGDLQVRMPRPDSSEWAPAVAVA